MSGTQGIPDDLKPSDELPVDVLGAMDVLYRRMCMLDDEFARLRSVVLEMREAMKRLS